jgi:hypothetical protein
MGQPELTVLPGGLILSAHVQAMFRGYAAVAHTLGCAHKHSQPSPELEATLAGAYLVFADHVGDDAAFTALTALERYVQLAEHLPEGCALCHVCADATATTAHVQYRDSGLAGDLTDVLATAGF